MRIDLSCPAEILRIEPPEKENPYGILTLFNLDSRSIVSCEVTLRLLDGEGVERGRAVHRARALTGRPHTAFKMSVPLEAPEGKVHGEATLDKVWFEDNDVWRKNTGRETEYTDNALPPGNLLNALKFAAGEDAVGFPSQQPELWVCVCGRPNANRETMCLRCQRPKSMIFSRFNREEVERAVFQRERQLNLESRQALEEANRLQRIREEEYNRQQALKKRRRKMVWSLVCALILCAAVLFAGLPALRLLSARKMAEEGRYEQARTVFLELGAFPGAEQGKKDCDFLIARRDAKESRDMETLRLAAEQLRAGDEADQHLAYTADFERASMLLSAGDAAGAEALLNTLPDTWPGRAEQLQACAYERARAALENREYEKAKAIYDSLGDYLDSAELAKKCVFEPALLKMEEGDYDGAVALLTGLDYQDSEAQIQKAYYLKGFTLENAGEADAAREAYLKAGSWEDAAERAKAILLTKADSLADVEDYESALPMYQELDGYADAREKWQRTAYTLAAKYYRNKEYTRIIDMLDALPEQSTDTARIRTKAIYQAARAAGKAESYAEGIALLERIPEYQDAEELLQHWRYELARTYLEEEKWQEAISLLEQTGNYRQSRKLLKQAQEKLAEALAPAETPAPEGTEVPAESEAAPAAKETAPAESAESPAPEAGN